jgi:type IV secretory pathway protease TraF
MNRAKAEAGVRATSGTRGPLRRRPARESLSILAFGATTALATGAVLVVRPLPLLVWNASDSERRGLYRVEPKLLPGVGDMAIAFAPRQAQSLAASRSYLPKNVPLVKRVAASLGDRVCETGTVVTINGQLEARLEEHDAAGRELPRWTGCITLKRGDYFLLGDHRWSFDGRYFGITHSNEIIGKAALMWPR